MAHKLVLEALSEWVASQPSQKVWTFLDDKGEVSDSFTYQVSEDNSIVAIFDGLNLFMGCRNLIARLLPLRLIY
jgi:hypothetical protein